MPVEQRTLEVDSPPITKVGQRLREGLKKSFGKMPYFIVHDAVYVPENKSVEVQELCERALKKYLGFEGRWERG